jgi:hypothetical protein
MTCGIYKITCKETGMCYIGQSIDMERLRWSRHKKGRYPEDKFDYEIVVQCFEEKEILDFWERYCIDVYSSLHPLGFNHTRGGNGWGSKNPDETRKKLSEAAKRQHERLNLDGSFGHSQETREKMSVAKIGKKRGETSDEVRGKISKALTGRKRNDFSQDHKDKIRDSVLKRPIVVCPYCKKTGKIAQMKQWHFERCKKKDNFNIIRNND